VALGSFYEATLREARFLVRKDCEEELDILLTITMVDNTSRDGSVNFKGVGRDGQNWSGSYNFLDGSYGSIEKI
jgi:hypothetical protein